MQESAFMFQHGVVLTYAFGLKVKWDFILSANPLKVSGTPPAHLSQTTLQEMCCTDSIKAARSAECQWGQPKSIIAKLIVGIWSVLWKTRPLKVCKTGMCVHCLFLRGFQGRLSPVSSFKGRRNRNRCKMSKSMCSNLGLWFEGAVKETEIPCIISHMSVNTLPTDIHSSES